MTCDNISAPLYCPITLRAVNLSQSSLVCNLNTRTKSSFLEIFFFKKLMIEGLSKEEPIKECRAEFGKLLCCGLTLFNPFVPLAVCLNNPSE